MNSCASLKSVLIPSSVTNIGINAFSSCAKLTAINVESNNLFYSSIDGVVFDKSGTTLIQFPGGRSGAYSIPDMVNNILLGALDPISKITSINIPSSFTSIGTSSFYDLTTLTNVTIPNSVTNIGDNAFKSCTSLASIAIPNSVINIGSSAFYQTALTSISLPSSVVSVGDSAFAYCTKLTGIYFPLSVVSIGPSAFTFCTSLTNITIPGSVNSIGNSAFSSCSGLRSVYFNGNAPPASSAVFYGDNIVTIYYLPWTTGWGSTYDDCPTVLGTLQLQSGAVEVLTNLFGFTLAGTNMQIIVVEACTDLANPIWIPVKTNTLTGGTSYFSDAQWTNYPVRFYRLRSP